MDSLPSEKDVPSSSKKPRPRRTSKQQLDLEVLYQSTTFQSREMPEELEVRLRTEEKKADHEVWKEKVILFVVLVGLAVITVTCLVITLIPGSSENKKSHDGFQGGGPSGEKYGELNRQDAKSRQEEAERKKY